MSLEEFESEFNTDEACRDYIFRIRWPDGFVCPKCCNKKAWPIGKVLYQCSKCHYRTSVIAGTIFQDTHKPLTIWFRMMWYVTSQKNGSSALGLQRVLGLKSYETAWLWLQKLRRAMVRPGRDKLSGYVEIDDAYIGGVSEGKRGRGSNNKMLIVVAVEIKDEKLGRIRISRVSNASGLCLVDFIEQSVEKGSTISTDGWTGYNGVYEAGYTHKITNSSVTDKTELLPHVHLVVSLLNRWLLGTLHGAVGAKHFDYYLDEFTFRFNRRTSKSRGLLFYRLMQNAVQTRANTYDIITEGKNG